MRRVSKFSHWEEWIAGERAVKSCGFALEMTSVI